MRTIPTLRYILIALAVLILAALSVWYFFIRAKQAEIAREAEGRGLGLPTRSFESRLGSTYENIVSSLSSPAAEAVRGEDAGKAPQLTQVNKTPTAGAGFISGTSTRLRFVERSTGFVFDVVPQTLALERLTNTLVPRTYEALIAKNGRMVMRSVDESGAPATIAASVAGTSTPEGLRSLAQKRLPDGIQSVVVSPGGDEIFYITEGPGGGAGNKTTWDSEKEKPVFSSALAGWQAHWLSGDRIVIVQKPSDDTGGYAYTIGKDGALSPLVRNIPGLTVLPHPTSSALLYGRSAGGLSLFVQIKETTAGALLPIHTTANKCVWNPLEELVAYCAVPQIQPPPNFLDKWHRGEIHTADAWWRVDASAASAELLLSPENTMMDVENPTIDESGVYIAFTNAIDKSLWLLRVSKE